MSSAKIWPAGLGLVSFVLAEGGSDLGMNEGLAKLLMQGGALILVAWLVIQTFRVTLPQLTQTFQAESRHQRDLFEKTLEQIEVGFVKQINEMFITEIRQQRQEFRDELTKQREAFLEVITALNADRAHFHQQLIELAAVAPRGQEIAPP